MNRGFLNPGGRREKELAANSEEFPLELFTNPVLCDQLIERHAEILPRPEWTEKIATAHQLDLSPAELDEHLRSCTACQAVRDQDQRIDDLICTAFFSASPHPEPNSETPRRLQRMWEFQSIQERLASQKEKGIYTQYQPKEEERARKPVWAMLTLAGISIMLFLSVLSSHTPIWAISGSNTPVHIDALSRIPSTKSSTITVPAQGAPRATSASSLIQKDTLDTLEQSGSLILNDPLKDNSAGNQWSESDTDFACIFREGAYHSLVRQEGFVTACQAQNQELTNFIVRVQMMIVQGDGGGLIFRSEGINSRMYRFRVSQNGTYDLYTSYTNGAGKLITSGFNPAINKGLHQTNILTVMAIGSNINLYVNRQQIAYVSDLTISSGKIGLFAFDATLPTDVAFNNIQVWRIG